MYDFHKSKEKNNEQCFSHPLFIRKGKHFLKDIKRKGKEEMTTSILANSGLDPQSNKKETNKQIIQGVIF